MAERKPVYYGDYLRLDQLLACQHPESERLGKPAHDEMIFITVHQAYELWFKQVIYELDGVQATFAGPVLDDRAMAPVVRSLDRVREILRLLIQQINVLETMTTLDFLDYRDLLYPASGFQSWQFRLIEIRLGLRPGQRVSYDGKGFAERLKAADRARLAKAEAGPKLTRWPRMARQSNEPWKVSRPTPSNTLSTPLPSVNCLTRSTKSSRL